MIGASNLAALNATVRPPHHANLPVQQPMAACDIGTTGLHLNCLVAMLQAGSGAAAAGPLVPLNVKVDPEDACQSETGVSAALSDLLHIGMVTMRARAQQGRQATASSSDRTAGESPCPGTGGLDPSRGGQHPAVLNTFVIVQGQPAARRQSLPARVHQARSS